MIDDTTYKVRDNFLAPLDFVYLNPPKESGELNKCFRLDRVEYPEGKGIQLWFEGAEYPMTGFALGPFDLRGLDLAKRFLVLSAKQMNSWQFILSFLFTWNKRKFIENRLSDYTEIVNKAIGHLYLKYEYMNPVARGTWRFLNSFIYSLGIDPEIAQKFAQSFAHLINYDDAYSYRIQDLMNETCPREFRKRKEICRLIKLLQERDSKGVSDKFVWFANLLLYALWFPKVRRAWDKAIDHTHFEDFAWTDGDWYFCAFRKDYKFSGLEHSERSKGFTKPKEYTNV